MCRHLAYLGPPTPLAALLHDPPHALNRQSWAPRDMRGGGTINADGFGVGWYAGASVVRYRRATPMWSDADLPGLAATVRSTAVLAAVRSATVGMPVTSTAAAPFTDGRHLFSHNGVVAGWPGSVAKLAGTLPTEDLLTLDAPTDSALLWALVRARLRAGLPARDAVAHTVTDVLAAAPGSRLNFLLTDGTRIVATAVGHALSVLTSTGPTTSVPAASDHRTSGSGPSRSGSSDSGSSGSGSSGSGPPGSGPPASSPPVPAFFGTGAVVVASEPFDDDLGWQPVPEGALLVADSSGFTLDFLGDA